MTQKGEFREDLYYRLNVVTIELPPLSERGDDISLLLDYFLSHFSKENNFPSPQLNSETIGILNSYSWPGNIRELRNLVERISILSVNENQKNTNKILTEILSQSPENSVKENELSTTLSYPLKEAREQFEKAYLTNQLRKNHGNISKTAEFIGMERSALHRKLKSLGIKEIN